MGRTACTEPQCLYKGALSLYLTVQLHLYSHYGPYSLYRASVPVQGCTLPLPNSTAIPLLPLWAVRPVQSLSACTRVHLTFFSICYIVLCCVALCYVMLCYVMLRDVRLCYVMLCYVMLCYVVLSYVMLCSVTLCYVYYLTLFCGV